MSMYSAFKTDGRLEQEGRWLEYDYGDSKFRVLLARAGGSNRRYEKTMEVIAREHRAKLKTGMMSNDQSTTILRDVFAKSIVLGWETWVDGKFVPGIEGPDGKLLPFSRDNVVETFTNLPDLFDDLREQAANFQLFRADELETEAKN